MNEMSSRSHSLFTFYLVSPGERDETKPFAYICKFSFVDLAGSERNDKSKSLGKTFTEAKNINLSLHTLEKVILSFERQADKDERVHIPFRESNLTLILKEMFTTDSLMSICCNISPERQDLEESVQALRFCARCKNLKIKITHQPFGLQHGPLKKNEQTGIPVNYE
jgi:hypothetical protein